jgi:hypothetical protein
VGEPATNLPVESPGSEPDAPTIAVFLVGGPLAGTAVEAPADAALIRVGESEDDQNRYYIAPFEYHETGKAVYFGIHMSLNMVQAITELWHGYVLKIQLDNFDAQQLQETEG